MTTARDLIKSAMRLAIILVGGEEPTADETVDGLKTLNDLLENWSTERLSVWQRENQQFQLLPGVATYSIGPAGTFNTVRPVRVSDSFVRLQGTDFPVNVWGQAEYDGVSVKTTGGIPERMVYVNDVPLGSLTFFPVPAQAMTLHLSADRLLTFPLILTSQLAFPPGYERALRYALAINLAPEYGIECPATVHSIARDSKADIKRANKVSVLSRFDPALTTCGAVGNGGVGGFAYAPSADNVDIY